MASLSFTRTVSTGYDDSFSGALDLNSTYCYLTGKVTARLTCSSTGLITVGPVYFRLKNAASDITIETCKIAVIGAIDSSDNWNSWGFSPSKSAGTSLTITSTESDLFYWSSSRGSVGNTYEGETIKFKGYCYVTISGTTRSENWGGTVKSFSFSINPIRFEITGNGSKVKPTYTVSYKNDGGSVVYGPWTYTQNSPHSVRVGVDSSKTVSDTTEDHDYKVYFNSNGGTAVSSPRDLTGKDKVHWKNSFIYWKYANTKYYPGETYYVNANTVFVANYEKVETGSEPSTYPRIGGLEYTRKIGYKPTNIWADNNGQIYDSTTEVTESEITLYARWTQPQEYSVNYNVSGLTFKDPNKRPSNFKKTFKNTVNLESNTIPTRVGYRFLGWYYEDSKLNYKLYQPGDFFDDTCYNWCATTDNLTPTITLNPKWEAIPNTITFHYYKNENSKGDFSRQYTIDTTEFSQGEPSGASWGEDYAFLGWTKTKPADFDITKGVYIISDEAPPCDTPVTVKNISKITEWGTEEHYYGFWTVSGKHIKIGNKFVKCNGCYIKTKESQAPYYETSPTWKKVVNIYTKIKVNGQEKWVCEVGRKMDD